MESNAKKLMVGVVFVGSVMVAGHLILRRPRVASPPRTNKKRVSTTSTNTVTQSAEGRTPSSPVGTPFASSVNEPEAVPEAGKKTNSSATLMEHLNTYEMIQERSNDGEAPSDTQPEPQIFHNRGRRGTVCGPSTNIDESLSYEFVAAPKTEDEVQFLHDALRQCHLFTHLEEDEVSEVISAMRKETHHRMEYLIETGQVLDGDTNKLHCIFSGEVAVIESGTVVRILPAGSCFGEGYIMCVQPSAVATHRVDTDVVVTFTLTSEAYRHILTRAAVNKRELYEGFLDRVSWLKGLTHVEKLQLADCLQPVVYNDSYLIEYNTIGDWVFIILEGTVDVYGRDHGEVMYVCSFGVGDCVGELEFINHHRTVADVRARGKVKAARLHREHFEMCMGSIVDVLRRTASVDDKYAYYQNVIRHMRRSGDEEEEQPSAVA